MSVMELFCVLLLLLLSCIVLFKRSSGVRRMKLPLGPWELPIIGGLHHMLFGSLPYRTLAGLGAIHGPLMHIRLGEIHTFVASTADMAREILKTHDLTFANRPHIITAEILLSNKDLIMSPYGEYWRQMRKICIVELLSLKKIHSFRSIRKQEVANLIDTITSAGRKPVNLSKMMYTTVNDIAGRSIFGNKCKDQRVFMSILTEALSVSSGLDITDLFPSYKQVIGRITRVRGKLEKLRRRLDPLLDGIIREHRQRGTAGEDLLSVLLRIQDEGGLTFPLTQECIKGIIFDIFGGGSETTVTAIEWLMSELIRNPSTMARAQREVREILTDKEEITESDMEKLHYMKLAIKETLRLHPPIPLVVRECRADCQVQGYDVPEKARMVVNVWATNRDKNYWEDAEVFKPERFEGSQIDFKGLDFQLLPFGSGRRVCPGIMFGMTNIETIAAHLLYHFDWEVPNGEDPQNLDMTEGFGVSAHRKFGLTLCATSRIPFHSS